MDGHFGRPCRGADRTSAASSGWIVLICVVIVSHMQLVWREETLLTLCGLSVESLALANLTKFASHVFGVVFGVVFVGLSWLLFLLEVFGLLRVPFLASG